MRLIFRVRTWGLLILALTLQTHVAWALGPNTARPLKQPQDGYRWEQLIFEDKIRFLYNPEDFQAGGDVTRILVVDGTEGRVKILWDRSEFVQPPLSRKSINIAKNEFTVTIPADARSGEYPLIVTLECAKAACPPGTFYVPVKNDDDQILAVTHDTRVATIFGGRAVNLAQFKALTSSYRIFGTHISIDPAQAN